MATDNAKLKGALGAPKHGTTGDPAAVPVVRKTMANSIEEFLTQNRDKLAMALPQHVTVDRLNRLAITAINRNPKLGECTKLSLVGGILIASQLGLELNTPLGHAYLIPYTRSVKTATGWEKVNEAQFQLGYQGLLDLAYRSGQFKTIYTEAVYENDEFDYGYGFDKTLTHKPTESDPGELRGVYAVFHLKSGGSDFKYWPVAKIMAHAAKYSGAWDAAAGKFKAKSSWADSFDGMARVPVLKDLLKLAPKSIEFAKQITLDGTVKAEITQNMADAKNEEVNAEYTVLTSETGELEMSEDEKEEIRQQEIKDAGGAPV
jgi:recombination protein RecT